ncbi:MAG: SDR family oxidoreductase [Bacteroidota bacterium]
MMNKTVLISGVSGSIGSFLAKYFLANGFYVIGISRRAFVPNVHIDLYRHFSVDITDELAVIGLFKKLRSEKNQINSFIHCVGVSSALPVTIVSKQSITQTSDVNATASMILLREVLKLMVLQRSGSVVNISSITASTHNHGSAVYSSSKVAFEHFCKVAAIENARYGITLNTLRLPVIDQTEMQQKLSDEVEKKLIESTILKRKIELPEIATICQWLISEDAKVITGEIITPGGIW